MQKDSNGWTSTKVNCVHGEKSLKDLQVLWTKVGECDEVTEFSKCGVRDPDFSTFFA